VQEFFAKKEAQAVGDNEDVFRYVTQVGYDPETAEEAELVRSRLLGGVGFGEAVAGTVFEDGPDEVPEYVNWEGKIGAAAPPSSPEERGEDEAGDLAPAPNSEDVDSGPL
jgi:hypothetical protein